MKICTVCKISLPETSFGKDSSLKSKLTAQCKECRNKKKKEWHQANKQKVYEYNKQYTEDNILSVRPKNIVRSALYYKNNKAGFLTNQKLYKKANKALVNATNAKRRAIKLLATPSWVLESQVELNKIKEFYKQADLLTKSTGELHHVDHIIPLQGKYVSGFHCSSNLQVLTSTDNTRKGNKHASDSNF